MKFKQFEGEKTSEVSMIRVAKAVLEQKEEVMDFREIIELVSDFIGITEAEKKRRMPQFYTDMNVDGEFISLGENTWGLRTWYPVDSIDEVLTHENDEDDVVPHISPDGFDEYQDVSLVEEFKEEFEEELVIESSDGEEDPDSLDEYQDNLDDLGTDEIDEDELSELVVDDEDLLDEDDEEDDEV